MKGNSLFLRNRLLPAVVWIAVILVIWELASWAILNIGHLPLAQSKLPYLHKVLATSIQYSGTLIQEGSATFGNAGIGFLLGALAGVILAILMSVSTWIEKLTFPYAIASQMIPVLGLAPIIYGIVRDEYISRIIISGYILFFQ